jgi:hypothetical protein
MMVSQPRKAFIEDRSASQNLNMLENQARSRAAAARGMVEETTE